MTIYGKICSQQDGAAAAVQQRQLGAGEGPGIQIERNMGKDLFLLSVTILLLLFFTC